MAREHEVITSSERPLPSGLFSRAAESTFLAPDCFSLASILKPNYLCLAYLFQLAHEGWRGGRSVRGEAGRGETALFISLPAFPLDGTLN